MTYINPKHDFRIVSNYFDREEGRWQTHTVELPDTALITAGQAASQVARDLDDRFGDDHFWTVTLKTDAGDYYQLFHGRLS